jgi:hypothetical protein
VVFSISVFLNYRCVMTAHVTDRLVAFGSCGGMRGCLFFYAQFLPKGWLGLLISTEGGTRFHECRACNDGDLWEVGLRLSIRMLFSDKFMLPTVFRLRYRSEHSISH